MGLQHRVSGTVPGMEQAGLLKGGCFDGLSVLPPVFLHLVGAHTRLSSFLHSY